MPGFIGPSLDLFTHQRAILPDMFGQSGDVVFVIITIIVMVTLSALLVKYMSRAVEFQIRLEKELRHTRQQELKIKAAEDEVRRLKGVEEHLKSAQASMSSLYASQSYGSIEETQGNYGQVEVYQHYEQIPSGPDTGMESSQEQVSEQEAAEERGGPVVKAAVATAVPVQTAPKERGDFNIQDVFVVYRDGRLVTHLSRKIRIIDDSEIIGSMITAVQTFVRESFRREARGALEEMKFGDIRILMEYGTNLNIALVIRGTKYDIVRPVVKEILSALHSAWKEELSRDKWDGNLTNIAVLEKLIQRDLLDRFETETFHRSESKHLDLSKAKVFKPEE